MEPGITGGARPAASRVTLDFADPTVERAYRRDAAEAGRRQVRQAFGVAIVLWVVGAFLGPALAPVEPTLTLAVAAVMVATNVAMLVAVGPRSSYERQQLGGLLGNATATLGLV